MTAPGAAVGCSARIGDPTSAAACGLWQRQHGYQEWMLEQFIAFLQKNPYHLMLFGAAVLSGGLLIWPLFGRMFHTGKEVSAVEVVQLINRRDAVVIDVREASEYATGHITNARNIPEAQLAERLKELDRFKTRPIVVSCATGGRSARAGALLQKQGFTEVFTLRGGIGAWQQASMPLEK